MVWNRLWCGVGYGRGAQLVERGACNARVVGSIPTGDQYENVCIHYFKSLWMRAPAKM